MGATLALVDTGGARTMVDEASARALGLEVELATPEKKFGAFWGPDSVPRDYLGRVRGPVSIKFADGLELTIPEIKVIASGETQPLVLLGTDLLADGRKSWNFHSVGVSGG